MVVEPGHRPAGHRAARVARPAARHASPEVVMPPPFPPNPLTRTDPPNPPAGSPPDGRSLRRAAVLAATACLATGWLPMTAWALAWSAPVTAVGASGHHVVRSPWTYRAGTVGDLLLPVIVYGLVRGTGRLPRPAAGCPATVSAAVAAGAVGALGQTAWLADPDPQRNWLLVAPHTFSAPGWYHAVYLVAMATAFGGLTAACLHRLRYALHGPPAGADVARRLLAGGGTRAVLAAIGLFALTVVADSVPTAGTSSSRATIAVVTLPVAAALGLAVAVLGRDARHLARPLAVGVLVTDCAAGLAALAPS